MSLLTCEYLVVKLPDTSNEHQYPRLLFPEGFDERAAFEMSMKGWVSAQVEAEDGERYSVYFSDPVRLQQDLNDQVQRGAPCFTEPGLIVLPEVTIEAAQNAVWFLWKESFFKHLKACRDDESGTIDNSLVPAFIPPFGQPGVEIRTSD